MHSRKSEKISSMRELLEHLSKPVSASESSSRDHLSERFSKRIETSESRSRVLSSEPISASEFSSRDYLSERFSKRIEASDDECSSFEKVIKVRKRRLARSAYLVLNE